MKIPRRQRAIPLVTLPAQARRVLAESAKPGCKRCVDGIERTQRGALAIICECAYETFHAASAWQLDQKRRRAAGMPLSSAKLEGGKLTTEPETGTEIAAWQPQLHIQDSVE